MIKLSDKTYQILKWVVIIVMPALNVLISSLFGTWGIPYAEQIVATLSAVDVFLGALLGVSTYNYNKEKQNGDEQ